MQIHGCCSESIQDRRIEPNSDHAVLADKCPLASTICSWCILQLMFQWMPPKQPQTLKMTYATVLHGQQEIRKVGPRRISVRRVLSISLRNNPTTSASGEGRCSAISVRSSITPRQTVLRILQINCRLLERHWRVRFRKELWTRICTKKGCDFSMLNVARCVIVMVYFQYVWHFK